MLRELLISFGLYIVSELELTRRCIGFLSLFAFLEMISFIPLHVSLELLMFSRSLTVIMVTEVETVLNSRPLTYLYLDIEDNPPLMPAHFLCGYRLTTLPNLVQDKEDVDPLFVPPSRKPHGPESKNFQGELSIMNNY